MALTVYKYPIPFEDDFTLNLPEGARLLSFQAQDDEPCLWALVDAKATPTPRRFRLAGTGHPIGLSASALEFVGRAQFHGGSIVLHLFEVLS